MKILHRISATLFKFSCVIKKRKKRNLRNVILFTWSRKDQESLSTDYRILTEFQHLDWKWLLCTYQRSASFLLIENNPNLTVSWISVHPCPIKTWQRLMYSVILSLYVSINLKWNLQYILFHKFFSGLWTEENVYLCNDGIRWNICNE